MVYRMALPTVDLEMAVDQSVCVCLLSDLGTSPSYLLQLADSFDSTPSTILVSSHGKQLEESDYLWMES